MQNEAVDDELEHFEDVIEETDNEPSTVSNKQNDDIAIVQSGEDAKPDAGSSESEDDHPASSEDDDSDDAFEDADFVLANGEMNHKKSKTVSDNEGLQSQVSTKKSLLPGGYDPRYREPAYW